MAATIEQAGDRLPAPVEVVAVVDYPFETHVHLGSNRISPGNPGDAACGTCRWEAEQARERDRKLAEAALAARPPLAYLSIDEAEGQAAYIREYASLHEMAEDRGWYGSPPWCVVVRLGVGDGALYGVLDDNMIARYDEDGEGYFHINIKRLQAWLNHPACWVRPKGWLMKAIRLEEKEQTHDSSSGS